MYRSTTCLFCSTDKGQPLTREHIWSDWMTDAIRSIQPARPKEDDLFTIVQRGEGTTETVNIVRRSRRMDEKPQCLCHQCNHERLGRVENEFFKPVVERMMLSGEPRALEVEDCLAIAVWAFKTLVVHNHAYNKPPFLYSRIERKRFILTLLPPETNFRVWLGRFNVPGRTGHMTGLPLGASATAERHFKRLGAYALTFTTGQLLLQMHVVIPPNDRRRTDFTRFFPEPIYWRDKTVTIWPLTAHDDVAWPPRNEILNSELDDFCCRWGGKLSGSLADIAPTGATAVIPSV